MRPRLAAVLAWSWFGLFVAVAIAFALFLHSRRLDGVPLDLTTVFDLSGPVSLLVGALIVSRRPGNVIGLLLMVSGTFACVPWFSLESFAPTDPAAIGPLWIALDLLSDFAFVSLVFPNLFLLLLFPTGRTPGPRWRWLGLYGALVTLTLAFLIVTNPELQIGDATVRNPLSPFEATPELPSAPFLAAIILFAVGSAAAPFVRYRRAGATERAQIRWLFYVGALYLTAFVFSAITGFERRSPFEVAVGVLWGLSGLAIPVAIAIAILRHRLFDIDRLIRRTLQYGVLTGLLVGIYFGGVLLLQTLLGARTDWAESPVAVAVTTLALAALFNPLRRRVQRFIDRRFYRSRVDAEQVIARFAALARDEIDLGQLRAALLGTVFETLQPKRVGLWLRSELDEKRGSG